MSPIIKLYCEHGPTGGQFTSLQDILATPQLIDTDEWLDLENSQSLAPYGAIEINFPRTGVKWFSHGAEDIEEYIRFLSQSLYATGEGEIPDHQKPFQKVETYLGFDNVIAKIWEQPDRNFFIAMENDLVTLIVVRHDHPIQQMSMDLETWCLATKAALQTFARFYQKVVLPTFLASTTKNEARNAVDVISKDLHFHLGKEYSFSGLTEH